MLIKPGLNGIPMDDIAGDLIENRDFTTNKDVKNKFDNEAKKLVKNVDGDINTAPNAKKLGGKSASEYLTAEQGQKIEGIADKMSAIFSDEIRNVRSELYQLYSTLTKSGYIDDEITFEGFVDAFKNNNIKYTERICGIDKDSIQRTESLTLNDSTKYNDFVPGERFAIHKKDEDTDQYQFQTVVNCNGAGRLDFDNQTTLLSDKTKVDLVKSCGMYIRNSFSFCKVEQGKNPSSREKYHMQSDDSSTRALPIKNKNTGYAISFKVPKTSVVDGQACVLRFETIGNAVGNPGDLICYIVDEDSVYTDGQLSPRFSSIEDAKNKGFVLSQSQPVSYQNAIKNESTISFNFYNKAGTNEYPIINDKRYVFLIECVDADENNYWNILFSYYKKAADNIEDLEKYNTSLMYKKIETPELSNHNALSIVDDVDKFDMLFTLVTKDIINKKEIGFTEGLYTAKITLPKPIDVSRARLSMKINREGFYYAMSWNETFTEFTLGKADEFAHSVTDLNFLEGDKVIIGNQIGTIVNSSGNKIKLKEPVYIDSRMDRLYPNIKVGENIVTAIPVYRMNYTATIKPYLVDYENYDTENNQFRSKEVTNKFLNMNLDAIIPTGSKKSDSRISDKLIFQADFGDDEKTKLSNKANEFELQIYWKSNFDATSLNEDDNYHDGFNELIGRIYELIVTFDKDY